jgi:hypothetical protein
MFTLPVSVSISICLSTTSVVKPKIHPMQYELIDIKRNNEIYIHETEIKIYYLTICAGAALT